jgi:hypothetical protein
MNPDAYSHVYFCPECKELRSGVCSIAEAAKGGLIRVFLVCCHTLTLTQEQSDNLRVEMAYFSPSLPPRFTN